MEVGKQATLNDLNDLSAEFNQLKTDFEVVKNNSENGAVGTVIEGDSNGELGAGARSFGIKSFFTMDSGNNTYLHIKTSLSPAANDSVFSFSVSGYAYAEAKIVDCKFVGYCNKTSGSILSTEVIGTHLPPSLPSLYLSSDGFVTMRLFFLDIYYLTLVLDSMKVGNGRLFDSSDIEIIKSTEEAI